MKKIIQHGGQLIAICLVLVACDKEDGGEDYKLSYKPISEETQHANMANFSYVTGDEQALYFYHFEQDCIKLCRKDRQTGEQTILDKITRAEDEEVDMLYSKLHTEGDYLYYEPFDVSDENRKYHLWRMKKDGTEKTLITDKAITSYFFHGGRIYYSLYLDEGFWSMNPDGSDKRKILDKEVYYPLIKNERLYYCSYSQEGEFHAQLVTCNVDGSSPKVLYDSEYNMRFVVTEDEKIYCLDIQPLGKGCNLVVMNMDGSEPKKLLTDLPYANLNVCGNTLLIACTSGNNNYQAGIYRYEQDYKMLMPILHASVYYISLAGNDQIVYTNEQDKVGGRFGQLYLTDFTGSINKKLYE